MRVLGESREAGLAPAPPAPPAGAESGESRAPAAVLASFAHTAGVFLEDWHSGRLLAQEVCETLWAAAKARKIVRLVETPRSSEVSKTD